MTIAKTSASSWLFFGTLLVLLGCLAGLAAPAAEAVDQPPCTMGRGFNAAWGNCNGSATLQGSFAFIDASQYAGDICQAIQTVLNNYNTNNANGVVVDARGFKLLQGQSTYSCSVNPWSLTAQPDSNVILLPPGTIVLTPTNGISPTWTLPSNTRILGQGPNITVIQACKTPTCTANFSGDMIHMGDSGLPCGVSLDCAAVEIEHLALDGNNVSGVNGIVNQFSQELGYVNDVAFTNISNTGLVVTTNDASNSGPYSNLTMSNVGTCVNINGASTRGVHGLTCVTTGSLTMAAIYVDGVSNSIEDVYIQGGSSQDGILVGSRAAAAGNLLFNITGSGLANVVHLSAQAADDSILGITRSTPQP